MVKEETFVPRGRGGGRGGAGKNKSGYIINNYYCALQLLPACLSRLWVKIRCYMCIIVYH